MKRKRAHDEKLIHKHERKDQAIPEINEDQVVTDLIIPRRPGKLMFMPRKCPIANLQYIPIADVEKPTVYKKYDVNGLNVACRFLTHTKTIDEGRELVEKGFEWFDNACIITPIDEPCSVSLIKEFHRYLNRKMFFY